jgi:hypothetical protein
MIRLHLRHEIYLTFNVLDWFCLDMLDRCGLNMENAWIGADMFAPMNIGEAKSDFAILR